MMTNPYLGLRPYGQDDAEYFLGRDSEVNELAARFERHRFLAVIGASGSGKSSLVLAGLLPALQNGFLAAAGSRWRFAVLRPGGSPVKSLASALEAALGSSGLEQTLRHSSLGLIAAVRQARLEGSENVLVLVDQFEELFRHTGSRDEPIEFVRLLLEAVSQADVRIYVLIVFRSDFLADCTEFRGLPEAVNNGIYLVPRMTRDQLRVVIEGPRAWRELRSPRRWYSGC